MDRGRPTSYTPEIADKICEAIAVSQRGLRGTLENNPELPAYGTVQVWLNKHAYFSSSYARAKRRQIEAMADDIIDVGLDDSIDPADKRIRVDSMKWLLSKLIPKTYGDKLDVTSGGEALAAPAHQIDARIQSIVMQAQQRKAKSMKLIDGGDLSSEALNLLD